MTVLHVTAVQSTVSRLLRPQLVKLQEAGFNVAVACSPDGAPFAEDLKRFDLHELAFPRSVDPIRLAAAAGGLRDIVRKISPDLVHFHTPAASFPGRAALAFGRARPLVAYTVHGYLHMWDTNRPRDRVAARLESVLSRRTDLSLFQSREDLDQAGAHRYRGRLRYLGNGVGDEWFESPAHTRREGKLRVVFVGRLLRVKGVGDLVRAVAAVPEVDLTIIGGALTSDRDGANTEADDAAQEMPDRVRLLGTLSGSEIRAQLRTADVFVAPSWREGLPRAIIEAMASGLPVITTAIRGCRELVTPGVNGWIVQPRRPDELAAALHQAATSTETALREMGAASWQRANDSYRESMVFPRLIAAYEELGLHP